MEFIRSTNDLIRRLRSDAQLWFICGFDGKLPHHSTFNRFYSKLANRCWGNVLDLMAQMNVKLSKFLPGFGKAIAIDGTNVHTHARQPKKGQPPSTTADPEAHWSVKTVKGREPKDDDVYFGYRYHLMADATYGVPMMGFTTPGNGPEFLAQLCDCGQRLRFLCQLRTGRIIRSRSHHR